MDVANTERALQEMRGLISSMQQEIAAAVEEKKRRDEEEKRQKQQELMKKSQMKAQSTAPAQLPGGKQTKEGWLLLSPCHFLLIHFLTVLPNPILVSYCGNDVPSHSFISTTNGMDTGLPAANYLMHKLT